jgi:hypothetical protein
MTARATLPMVAEDAIATLFERTINDTSLFWAQRADGSFVCPEWEWCCPEIPALLSGIEAVVFTTREPTSVVLIAHDLLVVSLAERRLWAEWRSVRRAPRQVEATTWDDRLRVRI